MRTPGLLGDLAKKLFDSNHAPYRMAFGEGLISGSDNPRATWTTLTEALRSLETKSFDNSVLCGAQDQLSKSNRVLSRTLLDEAVSDDLLRRNIVGLHPYVDFDEEDFDRCMTAFDLLEENVRGFSELLWRDGYQCVALCKLVALAKKILDRDHGDFLLIDAFSMRLHGKPVDASPMDEELCRIALVAAASHLNKDDPNPGGGGDYRLTKILDHCLARNDCDEEKTMVLDALFDEDRGAVRFLYRYDDAVAVVVKHLTAPFLTRALLNGDTEDYLRFRAFDGGTHFTNPLEHVSPKKLVDWCNSVGDEKAWELIANAIAPFGSSRDNTNPENSEQALVILTAAPEPRSVLNVYVSAITPTSWSGSRADIIAARIAALEKLDTAISDELREHLQDALKRLRIVENEERDREANRDREGEQRFE